MGIFLALICLGTPSFILAVGLWECWQAEKLSRKLPPL